MQNGDLAKERSHELCVFYSAKIRGSCNICFNVRIDTGIWKYLIVISDIHRKKTLQNFEMKRVIMQELVMEQNC